MRIWYQLLSSETGMRAFIDGTQALVDKAASPGTMVEVHGTREGALGDQYRFMAHYDTREVIENGLKIRRDGGYDAFVVANSLDPALVELREILDIPVLSFMEVSCFTACMMGETFGLVVPNDKFMSRYKEIVYGYGLRDRMTGVEPLSYDNIRSIGDAFAAGGPLVREAIAVSRKVIAQGAEVLILPGPAAAVMATHDQREIDGIPVLDSYSLLVKMAEALVGMKRLTGIHVSRRRLYQSPAPDLLRKAAAIHGFSDLLGR
jgi:Asp/Glu/hydantoin racemase